MSDTIAPRLRELADEIDALSEELSPVAASVRTDADSVELWVAGHQPDQPNPEPDPEPGVSLKFCEIPEIVFVRGIPEVEQMGIYQVDTGNLWPKGDRDNAAGWASRVVTACTDLPAGVVYDSASATLTYDGSGAGSETVRCRIMGGGVQSEEFAIRVLEPIGAYGPGADVSHPGIGADSRTTKWADFLNTVAPGSAWTYENPVVILLTPGTTDVASGFLNYPSYTSRKFFYLLGDARSRPMFRWMSDKSTGRIAFNAANLAYIKNVVLPLITINAFSAPLVNQDCTVVVSKVDQFGDGRGTANGISGATMEQSSAPAVGRFRLFWTCSESQMMGRNATHPMYLHGRPNFKTVVNCVRVSADRSSCIKTTTRENDIRNSLLSYSLNPAGFPDNWSDKLIDIPAASDNVIVNNELVGAYKTTGLTPESALIYFRQRRDWWGCDTPAYPDVAYPEATSIYGGGYEAPPGFTAGPETFTDPAFWAAVTALPVTDPQNAYTFKSFVAFNTFRWEVPEGGRERPCSAIRSDGTYPLTAVQQFATAVTYGSVPAEWVERAVVFIGPNNMESALENSWDSQSIISDYHGPGPWMEPQPTRPYVDVAKPLPSWFKV